MNGQPQMPKGYSPTAVSMAMQPPPSIGISRSIENAAEVFEKWFQQQKAGLYEGFLKQHALMDAERELQYQRSLASATQALTEALNRENTALAEAQDARNRAVTAEQQLITFREQAVADAARIREELAALHAQQSQEVNVQHASIISVKNDELRALQAELDAARSELQNLKHHTYGTAADTSYSSTPIAAPAESHDDKDDVSYNTLFSSFIVTSSPPVPASQLPHTPLQHYSPANTAVPPLPSPTPRADLDLQFFVPETPNHVHDVSMDTVLSEQSPIASPSLSRTLIASPEISSMHLSPVQVSSVQVPLVRRKKPLIIHVPPSNRKRRFVRPPVPPPTEEELRQVIHVEDDPDDSE